jgi:hypothetical protein
MALGSIVNNIVTQFIDYMQYNIQALAIGLKKCLFNLIFMPWCLGGNNILGDISFANMMRF